MKAVMSIYKSDAVAYCKENEIKKEDVVIITSSEQVRGIEQEYDELIVLSFPMGISSDEKYWKDKLVKKKASPPAKKPGPEKAESKKTETPLKETPKETPKEEKDEEPKSKEDDKK